VIIFRRHLALVVAWRSHDVSKTENNVQTKIDRNKNMTRTWYTDLGQSGGLYRWKLNIKTKSQEETETETSSGWSHHRAARPRVGPRPLVVRSHRTPSPARFCFVIFHI
jgi:hypothetical protein